MKRQPQSFIVPSCSLALLLGAAACSAEPRREFAINACALLEQDEIAAAIGGEIMPGERSDSGLVTDGDAAGVYSSTCLWRVVDEASSGAEPPPGGAEYVIVQAMLWPSEKTPETFLQSFHDAAAHGVIAHAPVPLPIGDAAIWWGDGVAVAKDQTSIGVSVRLNDEPEERRTAAEALAKRIVPRL
jgi:hypothetical protein